MGNFYKDQKEGYGVIYLTNKEYYKGKFKNNMIHGAGTFYRNVSDRPNTNVCVGHFTFTMTETVQHLPFIETSSFVSLSDLINLPSLTSLGLNLTIITISLHKSLQLGQNLSFLRSLSRHYWLGRSLYLYSDDLISLLNVLNLRRGLHK